MINFIDIGDNFHKNKHIIIELLIDYYGQEYSDIIKKRLENVFFDFSSTPEEEYKYLISHSNEIDSLNKLLIKLKYKIYMEIKNNSQRAMFKLLTEYVEEKLLTYNSNDYNNENAMFLSLFTDRNFNSGYIDAFSSKSMDLLNDMSVAESIRESIINDQKEFKRIIDYLGIRIDDLSTEKVDQLIEYRKALQIIHKKNIVKKSRFGKNMFEEIKKQFGFELTLENLSMFIFLENAWSGYVSRVNDDSISYYRIIRVPLLHLINLGVKGLDISIVHEMIHQVETSENQVGISIHDDNKTNQIINEIRTQNLAIKITKELHKLGIYIYDSPDNCKIEGESTYELFFPSVKEFLDENEEILSYCAINNEPYKLYEYFGESWIEFSEQINTIYYNHMHYFSKTHNMPSIGINDDIMKLINNMEAYKMGKNKNAKKLSRSNCFHKRI